ncbi:uncharacterized protein LOC118124983 isoform X2 [Hippoglossus stenolepis]|uniref:uncharacterized protein LOC118124983 isoform X2 n=1 Tax=Hippoglossus stenolepis TaxID=195615 RepID=UPI00159C765D|nr:uncharacterized protein LOC118124983 isoform X2 [Hippoglossus stenolepis]
MRRYWWPGFEMQLVGELQRQQNNSQFCDTLIQTEGISVPAHSCVLAALSPYLSWKLSSCPSPPSGQKYQLQLQAVKAQTLLKLVGLLYSGELEVKGSVEQNDVLALARQFGITDLKEGGIWRAEPQERRRKNPESERQNGFQAEKRRKDESRTMKDAQIQAEMAERKDTDAPAEKRSCTSTGTQTVKAAERSLVRSIDCSTQATPPTPEPGAQSLDFPVMLQPQSITHVKQFSSMSCPVIPSMHSGAPSDGNSPLSNSCRIVTDSTSTPALSSDMLTFRLSLDDDSNSQRHQEDPTVQQLSEFEDSVQVLAEDGTNPENGKRDGETTDSRRDTEQPSQFNRDETPEEEREKSSDKRHVCVGMKSLAKMKQMQEMTETTPISVKVKLKRRTTGEVWEVDKTPNTEVLNVPPPPSTVQPSSVQNPDSLFLQPATTNSPKSPPHPNTSSDSQVPSSNCFTPNQNDGIEASPLLQGQGSVEESDEQIEKLLEDIMMGLNILPNLERDCRGSHHGQQSQGGGSSVCNIPVTHKEAGHSHMHAGVSTAGCVFYQDLGTPNCSTETGIPCCFTAQNLPSCSALSSVLPDPALIQQQQEFSSQYHSSVRSMWQRDGMNHQRTPLSKTQESVCPAAPTARSLIPSAFFSTVQKINYPAFQEPSSRPNLHNFDIFPLTNGNDPQSIHTLPLPCMADFRLPRCLSPLEPCTSSTKYQFVLNNSMNIGNKFQQQPSLQRRPWLAGNPGSLQFPLSTITHRKNESASLPQDINGRCWSKLRQEHVELNQPNGGTWTGSCTAKEVAERKTASADQPNPLELKSKPRKMKELDTTGVKVARKRKKTKSTSHQQDAAGSILTYKDVKISDATKSKINLSICQVSLSSNNVLAKEREKAAGALNSPSKFVGKPNQSLFVTESLRKNRRRSGLDADRTPIKTRGFVKIIQESLSETSPENVVAAQSVAQRVVNKQEVVRRKRGRPSKKKPPDLTAPNNNPAVEKKDSHDEGSHQQTVSLPKDDLEKGDKTKQRCKKRRRNRSTEAGEVPLKKSIEIDCQPEADITDINPDVRIPGVNKRPRMVILKEFKKLINSKNLKMRKSKENQTNKPERAAESEGVATLDSTCKESTEVFVKDVDIVQPQDRRRSEESQAVVTINKNHNQVFNESTDEKSKSQREESGSSTSKETSVICGEKLPAFSFDALEEVSKLSADREQPLKNPDEGASNTTQQTAVQDDGSDLPQKDKPSDDYLLPQTLEKTGPGLFDAGGINRTPGCEEEEEEVDVLLYSPVKLQTREDGLHNMEIIPDEEEEEEDVNEIDVTGDEEE